MAEELIDIVNENGEVLRQANKSEAHKHGWLHKTVIGYLREGEDWILACQSSDRQDAGQLVAPVGGHVQAGETETDALLREAEEEIGTSNIRYRLIGRAIFRRQVLGRDENHMFIVHEIETDDEVEPGEETVSFERFTKEQLRKALIERSNSFGDAYYFVLEKFYPDYLPPNWENRYE